MILKVIGNRIILSCCYKVAHHFSLLKCNECAKKTQVTAVASRPALITCKFSISKNPLSSDFFENWYTCWVRRARENILDENFA